MKHERSQVGFTLIELLVVIAILSLAMVIVLPSALGVLASANPVQAEEMVRATVGSARSLAVAQQAGTLVHFQIGLDGNGWMAVMKRDGDGVFRQVAGWAPQQLPGGYAVGQLGIPVPYVDIYGSIQPTIDDNALKDFGCFNVLFGPDGRLDPGDTANPPNLDVNATVFTGGDKDRIWDPAYATLNEAGMRAFVIVDWAAFGRMSADDRSEWLKNRAQPLTPNYYTGQLLPYK
jgi:prepilin-type N-terminal cleavage/methylation domain-containing protein